MQNLLHGSKDHFFGDMSFYLQLLFCFLRDIQGAGHPRCIFLPDMNIPRQAAEGGLVLVWFLAFFVANMVTHDSSIFGNEGAKWLWFVILPVSGIWFVGRNRRSFKGTLHSVGIQREGIEKALLLGAGFYVDVSSHHR